MPAFVESLLVLGLTMASVEPGNRLDQLLTSWREVQHGVRSLVVEFSQEKRDTALAGLQKAKGCFRLIRTPKGEVFGSYEILQPELTGTKQKRWSGLLYNETVYLLDHDQRIAIRFELPREEVGRFLAKYFNPFVVLLDQKRASDAYQIEMIRGDEWYTYLTIKPNSKASGWFSASFVEGRAVLMNKASEAVAKDMPRRLWYRDGHQEYTFIRAWRLNVADAPKRDEFIKPEDRPGWVVSAWPFQGRN